MAVQQSYDGLFAVFRRPALRQDVQQATPDRGSRHQVRLRGFSGDLDKAFAAEIKDAESAYLETWRLMFHHVTVDGSTQDIDVTLPCVFINHFHQHVAHDFLSMKGVQDSIDFYILYVIRNPFENIASLKHLWSRVSHLDSFVATAYWRWEIYLLNILRNRALYGDRCDIVLYHSDPREMMRQLARSHLAPLQHLTDNKNVAPTALGIPLYGHSYKERQGGSVEQPYDYLKEFGQTGLDFLRARYANLLERLGVQKFEDAIAKTPCTEFFKEVQSMGSQAFENYMSALEISMRNLPAMDNLFYEMIGEQLRKRSPLRRVLDGIRIVRAMRAKT